MQKSFIFLMIIGITFCFISCTTSHSHIKRILFLTGDDYPGHKWRETAPVLANAIRSHPDLEIEIVKNPGYLASANLTDYDGIILHFMNWQKHAPGEKAREQLQKFVAKGGGLVIVHFACGAFTKWDMQGEPTALGTDWPEYPKLAGRYWNPSMRGHDPRGTFTVKIKNKSHPITMETGDFETNDELYTCLDGTTAVDTLAIATSSIDGKDYLMAFTLNYGKGRVFHSPLGHDVAALNQTVCKLFRQGCAWTVGATNPGD